MTPEREAELAELILAVLEVASANRTLFLAKAAVRRITYNQLLASAITGAVVELLGKKMN